MISLFAERKSFQRDCLLALRGLCAGTQWQLKQTTIVTQCDGYFVAGKLTVYFNARKTVASLTAKPMGVDLVLRKILGIVDNKPLPLPFLYWGAFTCPSPDFASAEIEGEGASPQAAAQAFFDLVHLTLPSVMVRLKGSAYADHLLVHPNQMERGAYATTLVASQIQDGRLDEARTTAEAYASGTKHCAAQFTVKGKTFHEHALEWLRKDQDA